MTNPLDNQEDGTTPSGDNVTLNAAATPNIERRQAKPLLVDDADPARGQEDEAPLYQPIPTMYCIGCDYALDGLRDPVCPECGRAFEPLNMWTYRLRPKKANPQPINVKTTRILLALGVPFLLFVAYLDMSWLFWALAISLPLSWWIWEAVTAQRLREIARLRDAREGNWDSLFASHELQISSKGLALIFRRWIHTGYAEVTYAVACSRAGVTDRAIELSTKAAERASGAAKGPILDIQAEAFVLAGRYEDAEAVIKQVDEASWPSSARVELTFFTGRFNQTVEHAHAVLKRLPGRDGVRWFLGNALRWLGQFDKAIEAVDHVPTSLSQFYTEKQLNNMRNSHAGARSFAEQDADNRQRYLAMFLLTQVEAMLDRAESLADDAALQAADGLLRERAPTLYNSVAMLQHYYRVRARCSAMLGKEAETDAALDQAWQMTDAIPSQRLRGLAHLAQGHCDTLLGRHDLAMTQFDRAEPLLVHPIDLHQLRFRRGQCLRMMSRLDEANEQFQRLLDDDIPSWMAGISKQAMDAID